MSVIHEHTVSVQVRGSASCTALDLYHHCCTTNLTTYRPVASCTDKARRA